MKLSVFSSHFISSHHDYLMATHPWGTNSINKITLSDAFDGWAKREDLLPNHWCPELFMFLVPEFKQLDNSIYNHICTNHELRTVHNWAVNNILLNVRKDWKIQTRNVKIRILAGMLNALEYNNKISKDENIWMLSNAKLNMNTLRNDLLMSDLPF